MTGPICRVLKQADRGFITSRGYRKATTRVPSAQSDPWPPVPVYQRGLVIDSQQRGAHLIDVLSISKGIGD